MYDDKRYQESMIIGNFYKQLCETSCLLNIDDFRKKPSTSELIDWIAAGEKPRDAWRIGTEHEKFPFETCCLTPVPYEGETSIRRLMGVLRFEVKI